MTLTQIRAAVAGILEKSTSDFTVDGTDLFLVAINAVRKEAELAHDFEHSRKLVTVVVDGVLGGSLAEAEDEDDEVVKVKRVIEAGVFDDDENLRPIEWTTTAESLGRQRMDNRFLVPRYPTDADIEGSINGVRRFTFAGDKISVWPKITEPANTEITLGLEVYTFHEDWTGYVNNLTVNNASGTEPDGTYTEIGALNGKSFYTRDTGGDLLFLYYAATNNWNITSITGMLDPSAEVGDGWTKAASDTPLGTYAAVGTAAGTVTVTSNEGVVSDIWLTHATEYLIWGVVCFLNYRYKVFVPRTEGNLPPPTERRDMGLAAFIAYDDNIYDQDRTHGR